MARKKKKSENAFSKELKKSFVTAIIAAFGFLTALAWRDVVTEWVEKITTISPIQGKVITAIIITIIAAIVILLVTKISND